MSHQSKNVHVIRLAFQDFVLACEAKLLAKATLQFYRQMIEPFLDWLVISEPAELSASHIRSYLLRRSKQVAPGTVHAHARAIRAFVRFMHRERWIEDQIPIDMPRVEQKPIRVLTKDELKRLVAVCEKPRDRALVLVMVDTGVRRGEAIELIWTDVDFTAGTILVRKGKSKRIRVVPIGAKARRSLLKWRRHSDSSRIFPLTVSGLRMAIQRLSHKAEIRFTAHDLRRTAATMMLRGGASAFHVQQVLGHRSVTTTQRYVGLTIDDLTTIKGPVDMFLT